MPSHAAAPAPDDARANRADRARRNVDDPDLHVPRRDGDCGPGARDRRRLRGRPALDRDLHRHRLRRREAGEPHLRQLHRTLRSDPRVAGLRRAVHAGHRCRSRHACNAARAACAGRGRHRPRLRTDHPGIVAAAAADRSAVADGVDVLDQANRRSGRCGAFGCAAAGLDAEHSPRRPMSVAGIVTPLALVWRSKPLLMLALVSFAYSATQVCLTSYLVVYLTAALGFSLVSAGLALTATTIAGACGRIGWGLVADRLLAPRKVLALVGLIACGCAVAMAASTPRWPPGLVIAVAACFGATAMGWNGVQLSEVARLAPPGAAGKVTGAASAITFAGVVVGPPSFALLSSLTGSYRAGFAAIALASGIAAAALLVREPHTIDI